MSEQWLVVGLGNPGQQYAATRHNVGYLATDILLNRHGGKLSPYKGAPAHTADFRIGDNKVIVVRSTTYMNDSGRAVGPVAKFFKIEPEQIIVVHDELDLEFGQLRTKLGGGVNGHNGLKSIRSVLTTPEFLRVRIGIGRPPGQQDAASFVLAGFTTEENKHVGVYLEEAADAVESLITAGLEATQNKFNR